MADYLRIDINVAAMIMLGVVFVIAYGRLERKNMLNKMFLVASLVIILQLFIESLSCLLNRNPALWLIPVSNLLHMILFITAPTLTFIWYCLIKSLITPRKKTSKSGSNPFICSINRQYNSYPFIPVFSFCFLY